MSAVLAKPQVKDFLKTLAKGKEKGQEQRKEHNVNAHAVAEEGEPSKKPWEEDIPELSSPSYSPPTSFSYSSDSSSSSNPRRRISLVGLLIMVTLFVHELGFYLTTVTTHQMAVDHTQRETLPIHINMTFPALPCQSY
ncbi:hypothetical protein L7F22_037859 [Adiantum nelumboides]|nr:hypothetical protein [Adiantum nelumboides]